MLSRSATISSSMFLANGRPNEKNNWLCGSLEHRVRVAAVAYAYGFPGVLFATIVAAGVTLQFWFSEGDLMPAIALVGFIVGLFIVSGALTTLASAL